MIDLTIHEEQLKRTVEKAKERNLIIPTFKQMRDPSLVPEKIKEKLKTIGLWDVNSCNLFRITWKNEPVPSGGQFGDVNYIEIPPEISGVKARIVALLGKWFPTGAHKVGASFGCLVPRLVTGQFDMTSQKAVWPSTGNYCRGGAYDSALMGCISIAILPQEMSKERFEWLSTIAGEVIATPGCESNVKEIFDKCWELRKTRGDDIMIFNQFEEMGNHLWHYYVTGHAMEEVLNKLKKEGATYFGSHLTTGSAGTIGSIDYLKELYPGSKLAAGEALQCPTILYNGYGGHRIEGIGDKHIPWIHNIRNTDMGIGLDDEDCMHILRLFNEPLGKEYLKEQGIKEEFINKLELIGISGVGNIVGCIKMAKHYELTEKDVLVTVCTDSMELYKTRIKELEEQLGKYTKCNAAVDYHKHLIGLKTDHVLEFSYPDKKRVHNLKYFTWIEQQGRELKELNAQWYDYPDYWDRIHNQVDDIDKLIEQFNERSGLLKNL